MYCDHSSSLSSCPVCVVGGGLTEITLTFDSSRVMYGFCSLKEPNSALPRYILINWVSPWVIEETRPDAAPTPEAACTWTFWGHFLAITSTKVCHTRSSFQPSTTKRGLWLWLQICGPTSHSERFSLRQPGTKLCHKLSVTLTVWLQVWSTSTSQPTETHHELIHWSTQHQH